MPEAQEEQKKETEILVGGNKNLIEDLYVGTAEQTYYQSGYVPESYDQPYNSDDLYKKTGDYSIYHDMANDDQVSICLNLKKDLVLGSGYSLVPKDDDQAEMCEELKEMIEDSCDMPFTDKLREILDAYDVGFSLTEKVFKQLDDGRLTLKSLLTRHPNSWLIYQDEKGNITKFEQKTTKNDIAVKPESLIHYVNNAKYQNPYGKSDLRAAYNAWFVKRQIVRYLGIFLESSAKPIPVGRYGTNAPAGTAQDILDILKKFQVKTALVLPKEVEVDFLEAKSNGEAYHKAINIFNMFIGRALFIPDLLGMSGSETSGGSLALGKEQMNVFFMHINRRRNTLEKLVQKHIIKPLVLWNYGDVPIPEFKFNPLDDNQAMELGKVWLDAVKSKVYKPSEEDITHFKNLVKFPDSGEVEFFEEPTQEVSQIKQDKTQDDEMDNKTETEVESPKNGEDKAPEKEFAAKVYDFPSGDYHKKVDFKAIETKLNDYDQSVANELEPVTKKIFSDLYEQLRKKNIINNQDISKVDSITLKYKGELKKILKQSFMGIYKDGQVQAAKELNKSDFALPTTSDEFLDILEQETFKYIGDYEYTILKKTKEQLIAAIKDGQPLSTVIDVLDTDGKKLSEVSLERFARTKHTEVLNRGRHEYFQSSGVVSGYQYSAILDDRTSDICRGLHGKKFKVGTEPIPPMHFNALLEGTLIETSRGNVKIEDIKVGDLVVTHEDNFKKVYDVMSKFEDKYYFEIELQNGKKIEITGEHPVLCERGWIRADELTLDDDIICIEDISYALNA